MNVYKYLYKYVMNVKNDLNSASGFQQTFT